MARIRSLKPKTPEIPVLPQCSVRTDKDGYAKHAKVRQLARLKRLGLGKGPGWDYRCCLRHASHVIDGKPMCSTHAGAAALQILLEQEEDQDP